MDQHGVFTEQNVMHSPSFICPYDGTQFPIADASREHVLPQRLGGTLTLSPVSKFWNNFAAVSFETPLWRSSMMKELLLHVFGPTNGVRATLGRYDYKGEQHVRHVEQREGRLFSIFERIEGEPEMERTRAVTVVLTDVHGATHNAPLHLPFEFVQRLQGRDTRASQREFEQGVQRVEDYLERLHRGSVPRDEQPGFFEVLESIEFDGREMPKISVHCYKKSHEQTIRRHPIPLEMNREHIEKLMAKIALCFGFKCFPERAAERSDEIAKLARFICSDFISGQHVDPLRFSWLTEIHTGSETQDVEFPFEQKTIDGEDIWMWSDVIPLTDKRLRLCPIPANVADRLLVLNGQRRLARHKVGECFRTEHLPNTTIDPFDTRKHQHRIEIAAIDGGTVCNISLFNSFLACSIWLDKSCQWTLTPQCHIEHIPP